VEIDLEIAQEMPRRSLFEEIHQDMMEPTDQEKPTTLVLADAHPIIMEGITALCAARTDVQVVAQCTNGAEAVEAVLALNPDVAVLELDMPVMTALEAARRIRRAGSPARILILAMSRDEKVIRELFANGANGYLLKDAPARQLFDAISYVLDGGQYLTPGISREVLEPAGERTGTLALLGKREWEIYSYLAEGKRPHEIARLLKISPKTVDTYRSSILRKLEVEDTAGLVRFALERNRRPPRQ
jgi:DNA-binding NarL/FixJ family response regulator